MIENQAQRLKVIQQIKSQENNERMEKSQTEWDIYSGNIKPYVETRLQTRFKATFLKELPICSAINLLKKITNQRASIYRIKPERNFSELDEDQNSVAHLIYREGRANFQMLESNRLYELQKNQTHLVIEPRNGKFTFRPIKSHQLNVIPNNVYPEIGEVYIFSSYDRNDAETKPKSDGVNQEIGDPDDYKADDERFIWWSKDFHFVTNGEGAIISENTVNPIAPVIPVVEISAQKDFSYWREITNDVAEFAIDLNVDMTMLNHIVELQGFSQAYLKTTSDLMPKQIDVGPAKILKLLIDPNVEGGDKTEFGYATPSSDLAGSMTFYEKKLAMFLSSEGLDADTVSGQATSTKYTSGLDRLLAMIERFEASTDTMDIYANAEAEIWEVIKAWHRLYNRTDFLSKKYHVADFPVDSELEIKFAEPSSILSEEEKLNIAERKKELGVWDDADVIAYLEGVSRESAVEMLQKKSVNEVA